MLASTTDLIRQALRNWFWLTYYLGARLRFTMQSGLIRFNLFLKEVLYAVVFSTDIKKGGGPQFDCMFFWHDDSDNYELILVIIFVRYALISRGFIYMLSNWSNQKKWSWLYHFYTKIHIYFLYSAWFSFLLSTIWYIKIVIYLFKYQNIYYNIYKIILK